MSYLGSEKIANLVKSSSIISPFKKERLKYGAYELCLGNEVFQTDSTSGKTQVLKDSKEQILIKPGQFALLLTEETIKIPKNKIAFISIKAGIKLKGLINVSGFHVDPGFEGQLVFSVYNAGPAIIILEKGEPYFPIWFAELDGNDDYDGKHEKQSSIPVKYIEALKAGELASPNALSERIDRLDEKKKLNEWLIKALIGLAIGMGLKIFWDWDQYKVGYKEGYNNKAREITADTINKLLLKKKNILFEIDSLEKIKKEVIKNEVKKPKS